MTAKARFARSALLVALALAASACAGTVKNMHELAPGTPEPKPAAGRAMIVFLRSSGMAYDVQSSVFVMKDKDPQLVGILAAKTKIAWQAEPGKHLFMVVGQGGDFISADVEAGKTYFATIAPAMGMWKPRFTVKPVGAEEYVSPDFVIGLAAARWVEKDATSDAWARDNASSIQGKYDRSFPEWMAKPEPERQHLAIADGR